MLENDARDRVIVALDCDRERALELAHELSGHAAWLKVGMTLYYAEGPQIVKTFKDLGFKSSSTLSSMTFRIRCAAAARSASLAGADLLSVHGLGSGAMLAACREGAEEAREDRAKLVAITVLTSMNQDALSEIGVERPWPRRPPAWQSLLRTVASMASCAHRWRLTTCVSCWVLMP